MIKILSVTRYFGASSGGTDIWLLNWTNGIDLSEGQIYEDLADTLILHNNFDRAEDEERETWSFKD